MKININLLFGFFCLSFFDYALLSNWRYLFNLLLAILRKRLWKSMFLPVDVGIFSRHFSKKVVLLRSFWMERDRYGGLKYSLDEIFCRWMTLNSLKMFSKNSLYILWKSLTLEFFKKKQKTKSTFISLIIKRNNQCLLLIPRLLPIDNIR